MSESTSKASQPEDGGTIGQSPSRDNFKLTVCTSEPTRAAVTYRCFSSAVTSPTVITAVFPE